MSVITSIPGQLQVIKRTGDVATFDAEKISVAIGKAFLAVEGQQSADSSRIHDRIEQLTEMVMNTFNRRLPSGGTIHIEEIQVQVELALMRTGEQKVARAYVIYRDQRADARKQLGAHHHPTLQVTGANGQLKPLDLGALQAHVEKAAEGLEGIDVQAIVDETIKNLYNGVKESDISTTMMMATRTRIEQEPNYTYVTARLLRDNLVATGLEFLGLATDTNEGDALETFLKKGIELELISPELLNFDLAKLAAAIQPERSNQFTYLGLQTLFDFTSSIQMASVLNCRNCSSCAFQWVCHSMKKTVKIVPSSSITCCLASTTWRQPLPCLTLVLYVHSCLAVT